MFRALGSMYPTKSTVPPGTVTGSGNQNIALESRATLRTRVCDRMYPWRAEGPDGYGTRVCTRMSPLEEILEFLRCNGTGGSVRQNVNLEKWVYSTVTH
ncbi:hypothetical protein GOBAR_AA25827 [Gossypium barbadense]|uniref:Uncharacterized protein n=1 Tax=Gossypium barbadense TaxID=3634 RepID=A0A2P5WUU2_GOSBA|nr:hypothetical protein GOBAR_AA25827 [Gossypium barbadense]